MKSWSFSVFKFSIFYYGAATDIRQKRNPLKFRNLYIHAHITTEFLSIYVFFSLITLTDSLKTFKWYKYLNFSYFEEIVKTYVAFVFQLEVFRIFNLNFSPAFTQKLSLEDE